MRAHWLVLLLMTSGALALVWVAGCSDNEATGPLPSGEGSVRLRLVDSTGPYEEVNLEIIQISVHRAGEDTLSGWHVLSEDTLAVNLLEYVNGASVVLADTVLAAGDYTQVRLLLTDNNNVVVDGQTHDLEIPSGTTSGLKLNHPFTLEDGQLHSFTLDWDALRSIHVTGNGRYKMRPVIRLVVDALSGSIGGTIDPAAARASIMTVAGTDTVVAHADTLTGAFRLMALPAGQYDVIVTPMAAGWEDSTLVDVGVVAGEDTDLGTIILEETP